MNVTPNLPRVPPSQVLTQQDILVNAMRNIARHAEVGATGDAHAKAMAFVDIEYEVWNALAAVGEPP